MELMGMTQNQNIQSSLRDGESKLRSSTSKDSSAPFQKKLDQFSKKQDNGASFKKGDDQNYQKYSNNKFEAKNGQSLPTKPAPQQKPSLSNVPSLPNRQIQSSESLADTQIQSKILDNNGLSKKEDTVDSLTHRAAIQTFMRKMESQLGIDPTEIVNALTQLSPQELALPPELNVDKIISMLDLMPEQQNTAKTLFNEMVAQSSGDSLAQYLKSTGRELSLEVMSKNQAREQKLEGSIDQMNHSFFNSNSTEEKADESAQVSGMAQNKVSDSSVGLGMLGGIAAGSAVGAASVAGNTSSATQLAHASADNGNMSSQMAFQNRGQESIIQQMSSSQSGGQELGSGWKAPSGLETQNLQSQFNEIPVQQMNQVTKSQLGKSAYGLEKPAVDIAMPKADLFSQSAPAPASSVQLESSQFAGLMGEQFENSGDGDMAGENSQAALSEISQGDEGVEVEGSEFQIKVDPGSQNSAQKAQGAKAPFQIITQPSEGEQAANVKEIVGQTNFLVKKGGGEAKVSLNPDGLGQVNLKVAVNDGQVSVEMVTESNEVKKILEKGLGDLKANLASHKLGVEQVRVDFSGEVSKSFDHAHDEAQRQSAESFMEQFRQENGAFRRNFFGISGARMTDHPNEGGPEDPLTQVQASKKKNSSRRLDLVA